MLSDGRGDIFPKVRNTDIYSLHLLNISLEVLPCAIGKNKKSKAHSGKK
jgi:hypothetical protein